MVRAGLAKVGRDLNVQEHGAMLLAEMACRPGATQAEIQECIVVVANIAKMQLQDK